VQFAGYANSAPTITSSNPWLGTATTSRAIDVIYRNLTGKTIVVYVCAYCLAGATTGASSWHGLLGDSSPPTTNIGYFSNVTTINHFATLTMIVPNGWYYEAATTGTVTLQSWVEQTL
jgi:hypothetical protein